MLLPGKIQAMTEKRRLTMGAYADRGDVQGTISELRRLLLSVGPKTPIKPNAAGRQSAATLADLQQQAQLHEKLLAALELALRHAYAGDDPTIHQCQIAHMSSTVTSVITALSWSWDEVNGKAEGAIAEAQKLLLRLGRKRLGEPEETIVQALLAITDLEPLERLHDRLFDVASWEELLHSP
jgi:hypothetical protein